MDFRDKKLDKIEDKIDQLGTHLASIDSTLAGQHVSLAEHIRRTQLLEDELKPIKKHIYMVQGAMKLIGLSAALAGIIELFRASK